MKETLTRFSCSLSLSELANQGSFRKGGHHLGLPEAGKGVLNLGIWQGSWVPPDLCPAPAFYQRSLLGEGSRTKGQSLCLPESKTGLEGTGVQVPANQGRDCRKALSFRRYHTSPDNVPNVVPTLGTVVPCRQLEGQRAS